MWPWLANPRHMGGGRRARGDELAKMPDSGEGITTTRSAKLVDFRTTGLEPGGPRPHAAGRGSLTSLKGYAMDIRVQIAPDLGSGTTRRP